MADRGLVVYQLVAGVAVGLAVARVGQWLLARSALPSAGPYPLATFAILFLAGIWLGNAQLPRRQVTVGFADGLAWLSQIGLFVLLGLLTAPGRLLDAFWPALLVGVALTFVARPFSMLVCASWFKMPIRHQVFMSWAGLRGAVPIVLATIPMARSLPSAERIFDVVFLLVVAFTLLQAPLLPWLARRAAVALEAAPRDLTVESAPLEELAARLLQFQVPAGSRRSGVYVVDLRLPMNAAVALVHLDARLVVADEHTSLRVGDHLLLGVSETYAARPSIASRRSPRPDGSHSGTTVADAPATTSATTSARPGWSAAPEGGPLLPSAALCCPRGLSRLSRLSRGRR